MKKLHRIHLEIDGTPSCNTSYNCGTAETL